MTEQDPDDATNIRPARPRSSPARRWLGPGLGLLAILLAGTIGWIALYPPGQGPSLSLRQSLGAAIDITTAGEAAILAARPSDPQADEPLVFRFQAAPKVLVLSFPTLRAQGETLNRLGAFIEKAGLPHDRVLVDAELDAAIRQSGDTRETYYYGHDYRAADLARFFAAADRDEVALNPGETWLRALLAQEDMLSPGAVGAVISIPPETATPPIGAAARAVILRHELSHGVYFTDPAYAAYARNFWETRLNEAQRAGLRGFLGREGYDTANEDLMRNEAQAYLIHTTDPHFFRPPLAGLGVEEAARLRQEFLRGMPDGWLKDAPALPAP